MIINLISDIHATLDPTDDFKAIYAEKPKFTEDQCKMAIDILHDVAHSSRIDKEFCHKLSDYEKERYSHAPDCYSKYISLVDNLKGKFCKIHSLSIDERKGIEADIDRIAYWHYLLGEKTAWKLDDGAVVDLSDVIEWIMKTYNTFDPSKLEPADYLVICGDLGILPTEEKILEDIKKKTEGKFKDVLYVAGNHSHWWHRIPRLSEEKPKAIDLKNDYCEKVDGDWLFLGCTLWTPIPTNAKWRIERFMNDYRFIPGFTAEECTNQFLAQSTWLRHKVGANLDKKIVVFTHHQPFKECIEDDFKHNDPCSYDNVAESYADLNDSLADINDNGNIKLWCCGHTHMPFDKTVHGMRVVRNPIGYSDFYMYQHGSVECDPKNWYNKIIDLGE